MRCLKARNPRAFAQASLGHAQPGQFDDATHITRVIEQQRLHKVNLHIVIIAVVWGRLGTPVSIGHDNRTTDFGSTCRPGAPA
jgi:hypothetical protein